MHTVGKILLLGTLAASLSACAAQDVPEAPPTGALHPAAQVQQQNVRVLTSMIQGLTHEIAEIQAEEVDIDDPLIRKIRDTDLEGMQLRKQRLMLLREHCRFSKEMIDRAQQAPDRKPLLLETWATHRAAVRKKLDVLDERMDALERARVELELELVERALK